MPPVVALAIAAAASGLAASGVVAGLTILGTSVTSLLINIAISFALTGILGLIAGANSQRPAQQQQNVKQPIPPRRRTYGRVKAGGVYAFLNNRQSNLYVVLMITQGEIDAYEQHYLGSDLLTVSGGGDVTVPAQYVLRSTSYVNIVGHLGTASQTADSVLTAAWSDVLDSNFRLRGIAYARLRLLSPKPEDFTAVYPAGLPEYNAVIRGAKVWDPRDPDQDPDDATTWTWTQNAALIIMDYLWNDDGMRLPRALIEAAEDTWKLQADACDANRTLLDSSTEAWYRLSGQYQLTDPPKQVLPLMLDPVDGRLGLRPDGAIILDVGQWQFPDTTLQDRDIYSYTMTRGRQQSDVRNEIRAQYVAPENNYIAAEAEPLQNTDSINIDGLQSVTMDLSWAPSHAQARYRQKIELGRHDAQRWNGQVISNAYGLKFLCPRGDGTRKRTIHLAIAELGIDDDFEVQRFGFDVKTGQCTFSVTQMGVDDYSWDASTDEGTAPVTGGIPDADTVEVPSGLTATVDDAVITGGLVVKFISSTVDTPTQANLSLDLAYRTHDSGVTDDDAVWTQFTLDGDLIGHTGTLPDGGVYDVRARFINPQGQLSADAFDRSITITYAAGLPPSAGGGLVQPSIVQVQAQCSTSTYAFTLGTAPVAGNILVAMCSHWSGSLLANSAGNWTLLQNSNGVTNDGTGIAWKSCAPGESTTQTPFTNSPTQNNNSVIFEITDFQRGAPIDYTFAVKEQTGTSLSQALSLNSANSLIVGMFAQNLSSTLPTVTNATSDATATNATGTNGGPRGVVAWHNATSSVTSVTPTAAWASSTVGDMCAVCILGSR